MAKAIVVVESPAKAKTINKYLGRDFKVVASMGHVRDLPKSKLGVDIDAGFVPQYVAIPARQKVIKSLRAAARGVGHVYIATDPDREGEAIGWHLAAELGAGKRSVSRLTFNEITKSAVRAALDHPTAIDQRMVDAQQARRVLDRLVGYKLSPLLWDKVRRGLSAGRVQSVALKLVCDREDEIDRFVSEEYWHVTVGLAAGAPPEFDARLMKKANRALKIGTGAEAQAVVRDLEAARFAVETVATRQRKRNAPPPFITSKLQQASRFAVKRTMQIAQQLYEGIELPQEGAVGLITYMRTDSTRVSEQSLAEAREHIETAFGADYLPPKANRFRRGKDAQDAHEAIRPTAVERTPDSVRPHLSADQYYLYRLIWNRFVASQMRPATYDDTTVDIAAGDYLLRAKGSVPKFRGWLAVYGAADTEAPPQAAASDGEPAAAVLPPLAAGEALTRRAIKPEQKFTQPPPRFSEATLVKELEENGIGRPSTYAAIIGVLQVREYAEKVEGRFRPTRLGRLVTRLLAESFQDLLQVAYTRDMEAQLDRIEAGSADYADTLGGFYRNFSERLEKASQAMPDVKANGLPSDEKCEKCGAPMAMKVGRFGMFLSCSAYPECRNTREVEEGEKAVPDGDTTCDKCGQPMIVKRGRYGQFLACTGYPECKTTRKIVTTPKGPVPAREDEPLDEPCPKCGKTLVKRHGRYGEFVGCSDARECRYIKRETTGVACPSDGGDIVERRSRRGVFYGCANYPKCDFTLWSKPLPEACPDCDAPFLVEKVTKRHGRQLLCHKEACGYVRTEETTVAEQAAS